MPALDMASTAAGHLSNFGGFGLPERVLVFDMNDFDETSRARSTGT